MRRVSAISFVLWLTPTLARASAPPDAVVFAPPMEPPRLLSEGLAKSFDLVRATGLSGSVLLRICIDAKGAVRAAEVLSSPDPRLNKAAVNDALDRRYKPAMKDGKSLSVWWRDTIDVRPLPTEAELDATCEAATANDVGPLDEDKVDRLPMVIRKDDPALSSDQRRKGPAGDAAVKCVVDVCGRTSKCVVLESSGEAWSRSALDYAKSHRYTPALLAGRPVSVFIKMRVGWRR